MRRIVTGLALLAASAALAACGGSSSPSSSHKASGSSHAAETGKLAAPAQLNPPRQAPAVTLPDSLGKSISLSQYKGKAVLITFIYTHCPDVCPLMVSHLHTALGQMSPATAKRVQIIAVSVDPKGDTPKTVRTFLAQHLMTGRMEYLIGSKKQLGRVWKRWGVGVKGTPDSREVDHSAFVYGITASGEVKALYPANFKPAWIAHDVPILAAS